MRKSDRRPDVRAPQRWYFPRPIRHRLDNGLQVLAFQREGQHIASVGLVIDAPLTAEPHHVEGVATVLHRCLDEGTQEHPGTAFADALEDTGGVLGGSVGHSASQLFLEVPAHRLDTALPLLAEAVSRPSLDEEDVLRHQSLRLAQIEQLMAHSAQRAAIAFRAACVPSRYRAARMAGGEAGTVSAITPAAVAEFHRRFYHPDGATVVITGDFSEDPVAMAESAFAHWSGSAPSGLAHEVPRPRRPHCVLIDRPGAVQADIRLGGFGVDRADPRWADLHVACHALGGAFLSRANRVLREEKGYTYGVHLVNHPMRHGGLLALQGSFRTDVVVDAVTLASGLLDVTGNPLTPAEVTDAVTFTNGVAPLRYATATGITEQVAALVAAGLSVDFVDCFTEALTHVTPESATQAIQDLLPPDRLSLVVVGDAARLEGPLRDSGWTVETDSSEPAQRPRAL